MPSINPNATGESPFQRLCDRHDSMVRTGISQIDAFLGGFNSSTITLIDSTHPFAFKLLSMLCVNAIKSFDGTVVYVDGWLSIDPYDIATLAKRSGLRADEALSQVLLARAFTAYQLDAIRSARSC